MADEGNPPAFPLLYGERDLGHNEGMSLRDWFAGQALAGAMANHGSYGCGNGPGDMAIRAYQCADAMLAHRAKAVASAIEARSGEPLTGLDPEDESAVGEAETPSPQGPHSPNTESTQP